MYKNSNSQDLNFIDISLEHEITIASQNSYPEGKLHPNRIFDVHDLVYIIDGEWEIIQDDIVYNLKSGDAIFLFAGKHHYSVKKCADNTKTYFIHFKPNEKDNYSIKKKNTDSIVLPTKISCSNNTLITEYFKNIISLYWSNNQNKKALMHAYTILLLDALEKQTFKESCSNNNLMNDIIFFLNNNLSKFYSIDELSTFFSTSKRKITYLFNEHTGFSPHKYQLEMKLTLCNNSINGNPKILLKDLASKYGFYDEFQLSKLYKNKYGFSPKTKQTKRDC